MLLLCGLIKQIYAAMGTKYNKFCNSIDMCILFILLINKIIIILK